MKIDRRLQQEVSRALLNTGNRMCAYRTCAGFQVLEKMRSWEAWCVLYKLILVLASNQSTVPMKIDGRQQQEETSALLKTGDQCTHVEHARHYKCSISKKQMRSWVAWCFMETFILIVMSNLLPVKIAGRQQHKDRVHY